jgi:hypothetical protein
LFVFGGITGIGLEKYQVLRLSYCEENSWHTANSMKNEGVSVHNCQFFVDGNFDTPKHREICRLLLLRRSGTELRVCHPKITKIPPNHLDFNGHSVEF